MRAVQTTYQHMGLLGHVEIPGIPHHANPVGWMAVKLFLKRQCLLLLDSPINPNIPEAYRWMAAVLMQKSFPTNPDRAVKITVNI